MLRQSLALKVLWDRPARRDAGFSVKGATTALLLTGLALAGCSTTPTEPPPAAPPVYSSPIKASELEGRWGLAAYHRPSDAARTESQAKAQCSNPYVITAGPNGGVMMYLADDNKLSEVVSKQVPGGPIYIGPPDQPAGAQADREVVKFDGSALTLKWVDPDVAKRYGTMVFVRCK